MKIEAGKYYRTRDGRKVGPMIDRNPKPWDRTKWRDVGGRCWHENGEHFKEMKKPNLDLIAEWIEPMDLIAITTPFGLLDDATREALMAHGGPYQYAAPENNWEWFDVFDKPLWRSQNIYRVKTQPPKPREWWMRLDERGRCCGTDPADGDPPSNWLPARTIRVREVQPE